MDDYKWALSWMKKKYRWILALAIFLDIIGVFFMTWEPYIFKDIVDEVLLPQEFGKLFAMLWKLLIIGCLFILCRYFTNVLAERSARDASQNLRSILFDKLMKQTQGFYRENTVGVLINKCSGDVETVDRFIGWLIPRAIEMALMLICVLAVFLSINWAYTLLLFSVTPFTAIIAGKMSKQLRPAFTLARDQLSRLNADVQENISGNRVVKAFCREDYEMEKFQKENQEYKRLNIEANKVWLRFGPIIDSLSSLITVINLTVGGIMVCNNVISLGQLTLFLSLSWALNEPLMMVGQIVNDTQRFRASIDKIKELFYAEVRIDDPEINKAPAEIAGNICFENAELKYGNVTILDGVNMDIKAGQTIGIMGPTGSGKTMLANAIIRFVDVTGGSVKIDGVDVRDYALSDLRGCIGMTMQDVFLFSDTAESNIAYGVPEAPMETVISAAVIADADGFIRKMPDGYDTIVGERGTGLSGGQKQRISLARALAAGRKILILDDTTSAVDMETEEYIQNQLRAMHNKATTIIIAQRVSSVMHADRIFILDGGKIAEEGTHTELMEKRGYYYHTCMLQHGLMEEGVAG